MPDLSPAELAPSNLLRLAQAGMEHYAMANPTLTFLQQNGGAVFRLDCASGECFLLKLHLQINGRRVAPAHTISARMQWLADLKAKTGLAVQAPVRNQLYQWVTQIADDARAEPVCCTVQEWVEGDPPHGDFTGEQLFRLGAWMARLHHYSSEWVDGEGAIPSYTPSLLLAKLQGLRTSVELGIISEREFAQIELAGQTILRLMDVQAGDPSRWGPIHSDIHHDNVLLYQNDVRVIDFDGMLSAPYIFDVGVTLYHIAYQGLPARDALFAGYNSVRRLPPQPPGWIETCVAWAAIDNLAFQVTIPQQQTHPLFKKNMLQLVREYCGALNPEK